MTPVSRIATQHLMAPVPRGDRDAGSGRSADGAEIIPASIAACGMVRLHRLLVEVALGRGADAVRVAAEVDGVEVALEDLVLRVDLLEPHREHGLAHLALQVALAGCR